MFNTQFDILFVDDEEDVLNVSNLAMRNFKVFGLPVKVHTAKSKAEAINLLNTTLATRIPGLHLATVAFIDVVMETDHAGLELCHYIREDLKNKFMQLYVRTGQPGVAPERSVIDRYDINGYITKVDATEDKLYTLVKTGVRDGYFMGFSVALHEGLYGLIPASDSRQKLAERLTRLAAATQMDPKGQRRESLDIRICHIIDDKMVAGVWAEGEQSALKLRDRLRALGGTPLSATGDTYFGEGNDSLIKVAASPENAELYFMFRGTVPPPEFEIFLYHRYQRSIAALWKQAK